MTVKTEDRNVDYARERNKLIPEAEKFANKSSGAKPYNNKELEKWNAKWSLAFHTKMNELWERR